MAPFGAKGMPRPRVGKSTGYPSAALAGVPMTVDLTLTVTNRGAAQTVRTLVSAQSVRTMDPPCRARSCSPISARD
jgi:hypothetical protein